MTNMSKRVEGGAEELGGKAKQKFAKAADRVKVKL